MVYLFVGIGGIVGSLLRYILSFLAVQIWGRGFPIGTLLINLTGSFLLGWLTTKYILPKKLHPYLLTALSTGVIGSYTTFSTFCLDSVQLLKSDRYFLGFIYIFMSFIGGLLFVRLGLSVGERGGTKEGKVS